MKILFSENIKKFRKERKLTQEQFAEVFNVTVGAVHKWEVGSSTPDLSTIVKIADFFDVSVDVLLGVEIKSNHKDDILGRLTEAVKNNDPSCIDEAEMAIKKYPHSFDIIYFSATLYKLFGSKLNNKEYMNRSIDLYEKSLLLLSQNTNININETTIYGDMAETYILSGEYEKGIETFNKNNPKGVYDPILGFTYALNCKDEKNSTQVLANAFLREISNQYLITSGLAYNYIKMRKYDLAESVIKLYFDTIDSLHEKDEVVFFDKLKATLYIFIAFMEIKKGDNVKAANAIKDALNSAKYFDEHPMTTSENIKYINNKNILLVDALGNTAIDSIITTINLISNKELNALWKEIYNEK